MTTLALKSKTPEAWIQMAIQNFDHFLIDHAACERKASATGMMFVVRCPDKPDLVESMVQFAREELMHFHQVWRLVRNKGLRLTADEKTPYINALLKLERPQRDLGILDRLLIFGIVEARGQERFALVGAHHPEEEMRNFYSSLAEAESRHHELFVALAEKYFDPSIVEARLNELLEAEAKILSGLPIRPTVH